MTTKTTTATRNKDVKLKNETEIKVKITCAHTSTARIEKNTNAKKLNKKKECDEKSNDVQIENVEKKCHLRKCKANRKNEKHLRKCKERRRI